MVCVYVECAPGEATETESAKNAAFLALTTARKIVTERARLDITVATRDLRLNVGFLALREFAGGCRVNNCLNGACTILGALMLALYNICGIVDRHDYACMWTYRRHNVVDHVDVTAIAADLRES